MVIAYIASALSSMHSIANIWNSFKKAAEPLFVKLAAWARQFFQILRSQNRRSAQPQINPARINRQQPDALFPTESKTKKAWNKLFNKEKNFKRVVQANRRTKKKRKNQAFKKNDPLIKNSSRRPKKSAPLNTGQSAAKRQENEPL